MRGALRFLTLLGGLVLAAALQAQSNDLQDATRLLKQGQQAQALDRVNQYLVAKPRDAQGRFLKGLILAEQNKYAEAIEMFSRLSQDYPELPEPYNNLAVLYAAQGQYEKARQALEMSIRTHPSYATAYENLGDVYTKLASQAYDKALQLDSSNSGAQSKLSLVRELISGSSRPGRGPAEAARVADAAKSRAAAATPKPVEARTAAAKPPEKQAESAPVTASVAEKPAEPVPAAAKAPEKTAGTAPADANEVIDAVHAWAAAWSRKDVAAYLSFYAKDFRTPNGESRSDWERIRKQRITAPRKIEVSIEAPKTTVAGDGSATVTFRQNYRSDTLKTSSQKTLVLARVNGKWLIVQERVGK